MTKVHEDALLTVETHVPISFGKSFSQDLNDAIQFTIGSAFARMIQFKCRRLIWTEGPKKGEENIIEYANTDEKLDYQVDAGAPPDPYYDTTGACLRGNGKTIIADQPGVAEQNLLLFEQGKRFSEMRSYDLINEFRALSFILIDNKVARTVQWYRTGREGVSTYHDVVVTEIFKSIPAPFLNIMRNTGYAAPQLQGAC